MDYIVYVLLFLPPSTNISPLNPQYDLNNAPLFGSICIILTTATINMTMKTLPCLCHEKSACCILMNNPFGNVVINKRPPMNMSVSYIWLVISFFFWCYNSAAGKRHFSTILLNWATFFSFFPPFEACIPGSSTCCSTIILIYI